MYIIIIAVLLGFGAALVISGFKRRSHVRIFAGVVVAALTFLLFWFLGFYGELLWFQSLGYSRRFLLVFFSQAGFALGGLVGGWLLVTLLTYGLGRERRIARYGARGLGAFIGGIWGYASWEVILKFFNGVSTDVADPILDMDTGFYFFTLPLLDAVYNVLILLTIISFGSVVLAGLVRVAGDSVQIGPQMPKQREASYQRALSISAAALILVLAWGKYLDRFHLMYASGGIVTGPGWTDVHIRMPAYWITALLTGVIGLALLFPGMRKRLKRLSGPLKLGYEDSPFKTYIGAGLAIAAVWFVALTVVPGLFQWLRVEPNEITFERPYIANNIELTRHGFGLHNVEEREFPTLERFTKAMVAENENLFENIRLWDPRALDAVFKQFQEIRLYYEFADVDIDRYNVDGDYKQVMVSARELETANLPSESQTFVNRRFKYTHGYGITMNEVSRFTPEGLPYLLIKNIPPVARVESLEVKRPEIYYGELTQSYVVGNSREQELNYPKGDANVYTHYQGNGGVPLENFFRKFLFGWKFDGTPFLLSEYPIAESRIMFHREIKHRLRTLAPFLAFDRDPYIVMAEGRLYWIADCYTTSSRYPYSEPFSSGVWSGVGTTTERPISAELKYEEKGLGQINYIRNSVKAVIDAYNGSVDLYIFEENDPLITVWDKIFPGLFKKKEAMPEPLYNHIRYPADLLEIQGLVYAKYHMTDPTVFYNQEDLWVRATEKYYGDVQPVEPYYIMWEPPDRNAVEFILMLPFTPKNRQVLIGWIAGMCDPPNYGRLLGYNFPKQERVIGTQQVETKIDQDRFLSGQLTLWDQRGSQVIRGNVLVIPIKKSLLYVEPIYLQAVTAAYPELRLVVVMQGDNMTYGESFEEALNLLLEGEGMRPTDGRAAVPAPGIGLEGLIQQADRAFNEYLGRLADKRFREAAGALEDLQKALEGLMETQPEQTGIQEKGQQDGIGEQGGNTNP
ncbi:MAG: UPF0182 family protein [Desulfobacterales bacterium]